MYFTKKEKYTWEKIVLNSGIRRRRYIGYVVAGRFFECFGDARTYAKKRAAERGYRETIKRARTHGDIMGGEVAYIIEPEDVPTSTPAPVIEKAWY